MQSFKEKVEYLENKPINEEMDDDEKERWAVELADVKEKLQEALQEFDEDSFVSSRKERSIQGTYEQMNNLLSIAKKFQK